jgi:hypothetical protein
MIQRVSYWPVNSIGLSIASPDNRPDPFICRSGFLVYLIPREHDFQRPQREMTMTLLFAAALVAGTVASFGMANAMPLAPVAPSTHADVIQVAGGCGPGMHRGPRGGCRVNRGRIIVAPPRYVRPMVRRCGPGMVWRHGRCWR